MSERNTFTIDTRRLQQALKSFDSPTIERIAVPRLRKAAQAGARLTKNLARRELGSHRQTGRMRSRIRTKWWGTGWGFAAGVKTTAPQSNLIVGGVRPHAITAGGKIMPMWNGRGAFRKGEGRGITGFTRKVENHPGFAPDPFFQRAVDKTTATIERLLDAAIADIASDLAKDIQRH